MVPKWYQNGARMVPKWNQNDPWRWKKFENRGDPEKAVIVPISTAHILTKNDENLLVFAVFYENHQSRKNGGVRHSTGSIREPGEEVGGGVNPSLQEGTCF